MSKLTPNNPSFNPVEFDGIKKQPRLSLSAPPRPPIPFSISHLLSPDF